MSRDDDAKRRPAVAAASSEIVDLVAKKNVELTIAEIHKRSPVLAELESKGSIRIVGAMYDIASGAVKFDT